MTVVNLISTIGSCRNEFYAEAVPAQTHVS
jgi:hypothetical protein